MGDDQSVLARNLIANVQCRPIFSICINICARRNFATALGNGPVNRLILFLVAGKGNRESNQFIKGLIGRRTQNRGAGGAGRLTNVRQMDTTLKARVAVTYNVKKSVKLKKSCECELWQNTCYNQLLPMYNTETWSVFPKEYF